MESQPTNSFIGRIKSLFNKKQPEPASQPEPQPATATGQEEKQTEWFSIYGHGFNSGVYKILPEEDAFPKYLQHSNELEKLHLLQQQNNTALQKLKEKLDKAEATEEQLQVTRTEATTTLERLSKIIASCRDKIAHWEGRNKDLHQKREQISPEYGWIPALLFLGAGGLFIWGDISITSDITSKGLDLPKKEGIWFAVGLAFTSFLIKPLLDRFFEKPYHKGGREEIRKVYRYVLIGITVLGLTMLALLGTFRAKARIDIAQITALSAERKLPNIAPARSSAIASEIGTLSKNLAENSWGQWGLMLSTVIFAIGGALCLAVAFPSLTLLMNKYWFIPLRRWWNMKRIAKKEKWEQTLLIKVEEQTIRAKTANDKIAALDIEFLVSAIKELEQKWQELTASYYSEKTDKEQQLYKDGYQRGSRYMLEGDLKFKIDDPLQNGGNKADVDGNTNSEGRKYTRRPFVKIRKMIADNYNNKQNQSTQDGTEFEIVS